MDPVQFLKCISFFSLDRIIIYWNRLCDLRSLVGLPVWFCWTNIFAGFLSCDWLILYIKVIPVTCCRVIVIYTLLTKREVKMAGYWPTSVFGPRQIRGP